MFMMNVITMVTKKRCKKNIRKKLFKQKLQQDKKIIAQHKDRAKKCPCYKKEVEDKVEKEMVMMNGKTQ